MKSKSEIKRLLSLATQLGFEDDIEHWNNELKKLTTEGEPND